MTLRLQTRQCRVTVRILQSTWKGNLVNNWKWLWEHCYLIGWNRKQLINDYSHLMCIHLRVEIRYFSTMNKCDIEWHKKINVVFYISKQPCTVWLQTNPIFLGKLDIATLYVIKQHVSQYSYLLPVTGYSLPIKIPAACIRTNKYCE